MGYMCGSVSLRQYSPVVRLGMVPLCPPCEVHGKVASISSVAGCCRVPCPALPVGGGLAGGVVFQRRPSGDWGAVCRSMATSKWENEPRPGLVVKRLEGGTSTSTSTAAINKLLEIWTCWVYGVGWGDFVSTFANANANAARSARCWRQKKDEKQTKKTCMIIHKTLEIWTKLRGQN